MKEIIRKNNLNKIIDNKEIRDSNIISKIINLDVFKKSQNIGIYYPINNEVNILNIFKIIKNKNYYLPKVMNNEIIYLYLEDMNNLIKDKFNIYVPNNNKIIIKNDLDLIIVPGLSFNKDNYRIGYGKGYYDRFLKDYNNYKIGVTYKEFINDFKEENHDIKFNLVISG